MTRQSTITIAFSTTETTLVRSRSSDGAATHHKATHTRARSRRSRKVVAGRRKYAAISFHTSPPCLLLPRPDLPRTFAQRQAHFPLAGLALRNRGGFILAKHDTAIRGSSGSSKLKGLIQKSASIGASQHLGNICSKRYPNVADV